MAARVLTFRVYALNIPGFSPDRDSIYVRGSFNNWGETRLFDATKSGFYSANVSVNGAQGESIAFKYYSVVNVDDGGWEDLADRTYLLGPTDVPAFVSNKPHIFGTLDPISPRGVRTGDSPVFFPISRSAQPEAPCHGWFLENFVSWDGNAAIQETGVAYSREPIAADGSSIAPIRFAKSRSPGVGDFSGRNPLVAGYIGTGSGLFDPGAIYFRAYARNSAGTTYGEQFQSLVPRGDYREWRAVYSAADFEAFENSTSLEKGVSLSWAEAQGVQGEWSWEIHRFESSQIDQNPSEKYRILQTFSDADALKINSRRTYRDTNVLPGWSYLYLIGIRDSVGLWAFRSAWVNVSVWATPDTPGATANSQTPYSVTFAI